MKFSSTRGAATAVPLSEAILNGLAPDGGLYVPEQMPAADLKSARDEMDLPTAARAALDGFFAGDRLSSELDSIVQSAFSFEAPLVSVKDGGAPLYALELYHGPTAAFKDFGARFLAECVARLEHAETRGLLEGVSRATTTVLVATSGDTGGAVAAAFHLRPSVRVVVLYPKGLVSARQEQQLTCWGDNVLSLRIDGTFDDCQRLVKEAFVDARLTARHRFTSANSINLGRLLPQLGYYAASSIQLLQRTGSAANYIIPAGNLGNACAAVWARCSGFPIGRIILAHNANRAVPDYLDHGEWRPRPSVPTVASAMDVGNPSNFERLRWLYPTVAALREQLSARSIDDDRIRARIKEDFMQYGRQWCPHTATAAEVYSRLSDDERRSAWVVVATAHPAKFDDIVEPILGSPVPVPDCLARLLRLPRHFVDLPPSLPAIAAALE